MREGGGALSRLIALDAADFATRHWDRAPLLTRAAERCGGFDDLLSSDAIDALVAGHGMRQPFFRMVDRAEAVGGLTRTATAGGRTIADMADPDAIAAAYGQGATLVLQSLHRTWPPVEALCRDLARDLGHQTQCNAYITPSGDAQGFAYHHDTHDVFVLQVEGSKRWEVYEPVLELPTRDQARSGPDLVADGRPPTLDVVLRPGDVLYLPRGYVHAARTTDEASVHLTVGVIPTTYLDLLKDAVARLALDEVDLRRALPIARRADEAPAAGAEAGTTAAGALGGHRPDTAGQAAPQAVTPSEGAAPSGPEELLARAGRWWASLTVADAAGLVDRRQRRAQVPEPVGVMARARAVGSLTPETPVRARRGAVRWSGDEGGRAVVGLADRQVRLPLEARAMLDRLLAGGVTSPRAAVAGDAVCDVADAVVVVRRLLREGVLVVAGGER